MNPESPDVSKAVELKLRNAMARLHAGTSQLTDGRLTKTNLAREAGVSRATMNRSTFVINQWNSSTPDQRPNNSQMKKLEALLADERSKVRALNAKVKLLDGRLSSAVTIILELQAIVSAKAADASISQIHTKQPRSTR